jgi:hypothetical protein
MTRRSTLLSLLLGAYALTLPSADLWGQEASAALESGPGPFNFDLDVAAGRYTERFLAVPAPAFSLKGMLQIGSLRTDPKWAPMIAIDLMGPKDSYYFGMIAFVPEHIPGKIEFAVRDSHFRGFPDASFVRANLSAALLPFELRMNSSGILQAFVGDIQSRLIPIRPFEITRVRVSVSGAVIHLSNVTIVSSDK